jgi:hypothetical protein
LDIPILKFLQDTKKWVDEHSMTTKEEIENFQKTYAAKYANSVTNVIVDDVKYLEEIYGFVQDLWNIIVIQQKPKKGVINISMFELLWDKRDDMDLLNIYGDVNTRNFFSEELVNHFKPQTYENEEEAPELPHTEKMTFEQIENEMGSIVHSQYNYYEYSKLDGSNNRFMRKQENTKSAMLSMYENNPNPNTIISKTAYSTSLFDLMDENEEKTD